MFLYCLRTLPPRAPISEITWVYGFGVWIRTFWKSGCDWPCATSVNAHTAQSAHTSAPSRFTVSIRIPFCTPPSPETEHAELALLMETCQGKFHRSVHIGRVFRNFSISRLISTSRVELTFD